jgi:hypothetical protein
MDDAEVERQHGDYEDVEENPGKCLVHEVVVLDELEMKSEESESGLLTDDRFRVLRDSTIRNGSI